MGIDIDAKMTVAVMRDAPDIAAELKEFVKANTIPQHYLTFVESPVGPGEAAKFIRRKFNVKFYDRNYSRLTEADWGLSRKFKAFVDIVCKDDLLYRQRSVWGPDGETILEESSHGILTEDDVNWTNPDFGKKTLDEIVVERGPEFEIKLAAFGQQQDSRFSLLARSDGFWYTHAEGE